MRQLQTQLDTQTTELKNAQDKLQQKTDIVSILETDIATKSDNLSTALQQATLHEASSKKLQQQLHNAQAENQRWQDSFEAQKAEGAEQLTKSKHELQHLQVTHVQSRIACMQKSFVQQPAAHVLDPLWQLRAMTQIDRRFWITHALICTYMHFVCACLQAY